MIGGDTFPFQRKQIILRTANTTADNKGPHFFPSGSAGRVTWKHCCLLELPDVPDRVPIHSERYPHFSIFQRIVHFYVHEGICYNSINQSLPCQPSTHSVAYSWQHWYSGTLANGTLPIFREGERLREVLSLVQGHAAEDTGAG